MGTGVHYWLFPQRVKSKHSLEENNLIDIKHKLTKIKSIYVPQSKSTSITMSSYENPSSWRPDVCWCVHAVLLNDRFLALHVNKLLGTMRSPQSHPPPEPEPHSYRSPTEKVRGHLPSEVIDHNKSHTEGLPILTALITRTKHLAGVLLSIYYI